MTTWEQRRDAALRMLAVGDHARAIELLEGHAADEPSGEGLALFGDAWFLAEDYGRAEACYRAALARAPGAPAGSDSIADKLERAAAAALTGVASGDAEGRIFAAYFTPERLASGPDPGAPEVPAFPPAVPPSGLARLVSTLKAGFSDVVGKVSTAAFDGLTDLAGASGVNDEIWTNWSHTAEELPEKLRTPLQILKLAYMREQLFQNNLIRQYPPGAKTAFFSPPAEPPSWALRWRTADGSWNDLRKDPDGRYDPMVGAAWTRFLRNVGDDRGLEAVRPRPSPATNPVSVRELSRHLLAPRGARAEIPFLNLWAAAWIQFMVHDWVSHGSPDTTRVDHVPLAPDDPLRLRYHVDTLPIPATPGDPTRRPEDGDRPPTHLNEVTHWWDGSQIYGSDPDTQRKLRSFVGGKLTLTTEGTLPIDPETGLESTGFSRNWWLGLAVMHTVFAREHNAICEALAAAHPDFGDEQLFQTARLVNAAVMAKIHTIEWTPAVLANRTLHDAMNANWYGLLTSWFGGKNKRVLEPVPLDNAELGGIVGDPQGTVARYGLSEEFTAVYRLHALLPDAFVVAPAKPGEPPIAIPLLRTRQAAVKGLVAGYGLPRLARSMGAMHPGALVNNNYPAALLDLSLPGQPVTDLGALDLYRDRERGVPPYNQLRAELGLNRIHRFEDLSDDPTVAPRLRALYGVDAEGRDRVDDIDLLVGTLCEGHRPQGFGFGETLFQVFILNASFRLLGDRFYTDDYREEIYTKEGIAWVDATTLKTVLLRHLPELATTGLRNVDNAFEPWDELPLDPARHPLRAFEDPAPDPTLDEAKRLVEQGNPVGAIARLANLPGFDPTGTLLEAGLTAAEKVSGRVLAAALGALPSTATWELRRKLWDALALFKFQHNEPANIPVPGGDTRPIGAVAFSARFPRIPIAGIVVADRVPEDEASVSKLLFYEAQVGLYSVFPPMQAGLPEIDADVDRALDVAYTKAHRACFPAPVRPRAYEGPPDLGALAVEGPYALYTERAAEGGFQWDLRALDGYERHPGLVPLGCRVLFRVDTASRRLEPVAIEHELGVSTPGSPRWDRARAIALAAASTHMSLVRHFDWVHLACGAQLAMAARNQLPPDHPLCRLLWPHVYGTQYSNEIVTAGQMAEGGDFETTFSFTHAGMCKLFEDAYARFDVGVNDPARDASRRGVLGAGFDTPTLDNLIEHFDVILAHTARYVGAYYDSDEAIAADPCVEGFLAELERTIPNGVRRALGPLVTRESVARFLASAIYLATVQHELVGARMWSYQLWVDRQPVRVYEDGRRAPLDVFQRLVNANFNLNVHRRELMHDFAYLALDERGAELFRRFRAELEALDARLARLPKEVWRLSPSGLDANINA